MKFDIPLLRKVLPRAQFHGFNGDESFDILNIARLSAFDTIKGAVLYFAVYEDSPEQEGWYVAAFDRTKNISHLRNDDRYSFLVDARVSQEDREGLRHVYVENITEAIATLCSYTISLASPIVVGITGSVGKTTAAAMVEDVLETTYATKRIYSKRLTPLTLSSWIINFLEKDDEVVVLEYSMYRPHHIEALAKIVPPDYALFLNVEKMHLGVQGINTLDDIVRSKEALTKNARLSILNADDEWVMSAKRNQEILFSTKNPMADYFLHHTEEDMRIVRGDTVIALTPYIQTKLFLQQALASTAIARELNIPADVITTALRDFTPEENRILWIEHDNQKILFDGDVTLSARLKALAENSYEKTLLVVAHINFGEDNVLLQVDDFNEVFAQFSETRVLSTAHNVTCLESYGFNGVRRVDTLDQHKDFSAYDFVVIHYGTYFRKFNSFDEITLLLR